MFTKIKKCRICENTRLEQVVDLGEQFMTGIFPHEKKLDLTCGPLRLVKCHGDKNVCGLLQLEHTYDLQEMYGDSYGYRSSLNASMVKHLYSKVARILQNTNLAAGDLVVDIGSNDGTTLGAYPHNLNLVGVDPTAGKFRKYYKPHVLLIPDFFSSQLVMSAVPGKKAKVITSFSMFYDLEKPMEFASQVASLLDPEDGIWVFEQSYMPLMMERIAYDTICHEHLEYYGLKQIAWMVERLGLRIIDVEVNDINGGSFSVTAAHKNSNHQSVTGAVADLLGAEEAAGLSTLKPYQDFFEKIKSSRIELRDFVAKTTKSGSKVFGLGASTKGNVVLQYCNLTEKDIEAVGEVNPDKFGAYTPGSWIPIQDEKVVLNSNPDYLLVLPWHFKEFFLRNPVLKGRKLLFPLPKLEVVTVE